MSKNGRPGWKLLDRCDFVLGYRRRNFLGEWERSYWSGDERYLSTVKLTSVSASDVDMHMQIFRRFHLTLPIRSMSRSVAWSFHRSSSESPEQTAGLKWTHQLLLDEQRFPFPWKVFDEHERNRPILQMLFSIYVSAKTTDANLQRGKLERELHISKLTQSFDWKQETDGALLRSTTSFDHFQENQVIFTNFLSPRVSPSSLFLCFSLVYIAFISKSIVRLQGNILSPCFVTIDSSSLRNVLLSWSLSACFLFLSETVGRRCSRFDVIERWTCSTVAAAATRSGRCDRFRTFWCRSPSRTSSSSHWLA